MLVEEVLIYTLGRPVFTKMDEFSENFRTTFDPPPRPFFGKLYCVFFRKFMTKISVFICTNFAEYRLPLVELSAECGKLIKTTLLWLRQVLRAPDSILIIREIYLQMSPTRLTLPVGGQVCRLT